MLCDCRYFISYKFIINTHLKNVPGQLLLLFLFSIYYINVLYLNLITIPLYLPTVYYYKHRSLQ